MLRRLFYLFIFFAPFTSFFAISAWLRLPVVINQLLFVFLVLAIFIRGRLKSKWILTEDLLLIGLLIFVWLSFLLGFKEQRSFNHSLAYSNAIVFYFFVSKYVIEVLNIKSIQIAAVIYRSFLLCSFIIIIDFIGINFFDFSLRRLFSPVIDGKISNMNYFIRTNIFTVAGVAEEPGHMANFYNIYFGISLYYLYCKHHFSKFKWVIVLFVCSHISLLSSAGIVLAIFSFLFIYFMNRIENFSISRKNLFWIGTVFVLCTVLLIISFLNNADYNIGEIDGIIKKITFNEDTTNLTSSGQRLSQWTRAISNFIDHPFFGNGPGYGVHQDSEGYLSVYLTILSDIGIFALFSFVLFQIVLIAKIMRIQEPIRGFLLFSVITSFLHLFIIADFYQAPIWVLFVVIQLIYSEFKLNIK